MKKLKKHIRNFFFYAALGQFIILFALFHGVQITLPKDEDAGREAQLENAKEVLASDIFEPVDHPKHGRK